MLRVGDRDFGAAHPGDRCVEFVERILDDAGADLGRPLWRGADNHGELERWAEQLDRQAAELDEREKALAQREAKLARRERLADERDRIADERDRIANHREQLADERELSAGRTRGLGCAA